MSGKTGKNGTTVTYEFPQPKEKLTIAQHIYNPKDGTFLGRDASSWYNKSTTSAINATKAKSYGTFKGNITDEKFKNYGIPEGKNESRFAKILLFYFIFYAILAALFAICMQGLFATLSDKEPRWQLERSLIGTNPGLGYRPLANETERGSVIAFNITDDSSKVYWIKLLDEFLEPYNNKSVLKNKGRKQILCTPGSSKKENEVCDFPISDTIFGDCSKNNSYGFNNNKPCIFLKLNKIFGWEPIPYTSGDEMTDAPSDLKAHVDSQTDKNQIWVSCHGQHSNDKESIKRFIYYPESQGFHSSYYPFKNTDDYLSPLVAVQIELGTHNTLVSIECRAWAKNIIYNGSMRDRQGSVSFQLLIDGPYTPRKNQTEPLNQKN